MKRYASHFLFLPGYGYLKQYVIETEEGCVTRAFPLTEEIENVEWLPGAIVLLTTKELKVCDNDSINLSVKLPHNILKEFPTLICRDYSMVPVYFSHFDIKTMLPVSGTRHRLLL